MSEILNCLPHLWNPQIGDPTAAGWLIVGVYCVASATSLLAAQRLENKVHRLFWIGLCCLLALLAVNKQLDLQSAVPLFGKCVSKAQGWYESRRMVQLVFVLVLLGLTSAIVWKMLRSMKGNTRQISLAITGLCILLSYIFLRAGTFNHIGEGLDLPRLSGGLRVMFELAGPVLISINAICRLRV